VAIVGHDAQQQDAPQQDAQKWSLEEYRAYLRILARLRLSPELRLLLDSSDVVQQTMLKAWENREQFRGQASGEYRAWLRRILANEVYDRAKKDGLLDGKSAHKLSLERALEQSGARLDEILALDSEAPPARAIKREHLVRLESAFEQLPNNQRLAVELHKIQGLSVAETARHMGVSKPAVAGLYARALNTLRKLLQEAR
jgi:RNA polymerase sigma-70 factor (ECF subfamily)